MNTIESQLPSGPALLAALDNAPLPAIDVECRGQKVRKNRPDDTETSDEIEPELAIWEKLLKWMPTCPPMPTYPERNRQFSNWGNNAAPAMHPTPGGTPTDTIPAAGSLDLVDHENLSTGERQRLMECEQTIREWLGTFVAVGTALAEIRHSRLYRETHRTFEEYLKAVLALSRSHAYNLIDSAQVVHDLSSIEDISRLPTNEAQARELVRIKTPEERVAVWRKVIDAAGDKPLTAKRIRDTVASRPSGIPSSSESRMKRVSSLVTALRRNLEGHAKFAEIDQLLRGLENLVAGARTQ